MTSPRVLEGEEEVENEKLGNIVLHQLNKALGFLLKTSPPLEASGTPHHPPTRKRRSRWPGLMDAAERNGHEVSKTQNFTNFTVADLVPGVAQNRRF